MGIVQVVGRTDRDIVDPVIVIVAEPAVDLAVEPFELGEVVRIGKEGIDHPDRIAGIECD